MLMDYNSIVQKYQIILTGVIHVGGHTGEEIPLYRQQTNNIHIFEPLKECFDKIDENVKKYNTALGSKKTTLEFHVANNKQSSSFLTPKTHLYEHSAVTFNENRVVNLETLDSYGIVDCNLLNMDVQGYELEVLKGAEHTLKHIDYIFTEVNERELYENCVYMNELDEFLTDFKRVETAMTAKGWGDALYIRKSFFTQYEW